MYGEHTTSFYSVQATRLCLAVVASYFKVKLPFIPNQAECKTYRYTEVFLIAVHRRAWGLLASVLFHLTHRAVLK